MKTKTFLPHCFAALLLIAILNLPALSQTATQFGQNKVHYKNFDWSVLRTEHFDVHYYSEEKQAAFDAARMAERGYDYLSEVFDHQIKERIPLLLYASVNDFQQTNIVQGMIGDGTRGVTESLKNRVALPITGSYREFNHVLIHELVHAFQFDIILRPDNQIAKSRFNPPLWFVEGMAEYLSVGMSNTTRMWVRDGFENDNLLTVDKLNNTFDIRVYRLGESLWYYIGETYGKRKVGDLLKTAVNLGKFEPALKAQLKMDPKKLTEKWHAAMRELVYQTDITLKEPGDIAQQITKKTGAFHRMNIVPAVSPDGKSIAYVSNKNLKDDIFLITQSDDGDLKEDRLIKGGESNRFEVLRFFDTAINWSRDGKRIAFVSKTGKDDGIYIVNAQSKKVLFKMTFDELNGLSSPAFSPDGTQIVFVGIKGGKSDLYIVNLADKKIQQLTNDRYAELHPQWSLDGKRIVFSTDRGTGTDIDQLFFGDLDVALYTLESGKIDLVTDLAGNITAPQWIGEEEKIIFVSDHQGIPNIYTIDLLTSEIETVTLLNNGVSGITESTPSLSISADGKTIAFSAYVNGAWQLFRMEYPPQEPVLAVESSRTNINTEPSNGNSDETNGSYPLSIKSNLLPELPEPNEFLSEYELADTDSIEERDYSGKLKLDAVALGGNIGGLYGSAGGAQLLFSDILGNHNLIFSTGLRFTNPLKSDLGLAYFNLGNRFNYGAQIYQNAYSYITFLSSSAQGFVQQIYRGVSVFAQYPFSRFSRIELSTGIANVSQEEVIEGYINGSRVKTTQNLGSFSFGQVSASYVHDNISFGYIGPRSGSRYRLTVQQTVKDFEFTTLFIDYRKYASINSRSVLAWRFLGGTSMGRDKQYFRIGGPYDFRGADYGELLGSKFIVQNLEFRFPIFPFLSEKYDFISGVTFFDAAAAWGEDIPGYIKESFQPFTTEGGFGFKDLKGAVGVGARMNLGFLSFRLDLAWPTDLRHFEKPNTLFSIGTDF